MGSCMVPREPVESAPMLPTALATDSVDRPHLIDLDRKLRELFLQYGTAMNDDVVESDSVNNVLLVRLLDFGLYLLIVDAFFRDIQRFLNYCQEKLKN